MRSEGEIVWEAGEIGEVQKILDLARQIAELELSSLVGDISVGRYQLTDAG